ncbi:uncharacterized protein [Lolium perenne]|uniref:uncharacterized protein n=1 Tax=Lolium perenne TaxID=4522 RepID=UPI003A98D911
MFKAFDAESETFNLQKDQPSITIKGVDVEEIFGLKDKAADGLDIDTILYEDGEYAENDIPSRFLNKSTGSLSIDGLISDAIKSGLADDDFLRRAVLVALGTVLAPQSSSTVPLEYWTIVKYVSRLKKMNFNGFTRSYLINNIKKLRSEHEMVQWPRGNLALLQYIYYEKVHPTGSQLTSSKPLMRNWTEEEASKRDNIEYQHGRGTGLIDDDISANHRREVIHTPDVPPRSKRKQSKRAKASGSSMKTPGSGDDSRMEVMVEQILIKLTNHIDTSISKHMDKFADVSAQKVLKMLNAKGVAYRAGKADMFDDEDQEVEDKKEGAASTPSHGGLPPKDFMDNDDIKSDGTASFLNSVKDQHDDELEDASKKSEPMDDLNFVTPTDKKTANAGYTTPAPKHGDTPEVPIIIDDKATPESSCSAPIDLTLPDALEEFDSLNTICRKAIESGKKEEKKDDVCGKKEEKKEDVSGKRKRKAPRKLSSPSIVMTENCPKWFPRAVRKGPDALFNNEYATDGSNPLTPEIIDAAAEYIRIICKSTKKNQRSKTVYENEDGAVARAEFLKPILDRGWLCGTVIECYLAELRLKLKDRTICPAWRKCQVATKDASWNILALTRLISANISKCHWVTVVMHSDKKEFQVLDSLWRLEQSKDFVEKLREEILKDVEFANNEISTKKYPDVSKWEIKRYPIPMQSDTNSCGLFLLACMEHWDGDELTAKFSQETINKNRNMTAAKIIMAESNMHEKAKKDVLDIAAKARA